MNDLMFVALVVVGAVLLVRFLWRHIADVGGSLVWVSSAAYEAEQARAKKWEACYVEFLSYGFGQREAREKADAKMRADAVAAEGVKP